MIWLPTTDYRMAFKKGMKGTDVAALQLNLKNIAVDGDFGPATDARVREYQRAHALVEDGIAGGATQTLMCKKLSAAAADASGLPAGFLPSLIVNESGFYLAAVSRHPSDAGLDVGAYQRSSGHSPGDQTFYAAAYDVGSSATVAAHAAKKLHDDTYSAPVASSRYYTELAGGNADKFAWQMAALNHNWPAAAASIPKNGYATSGVSGDDSPSEWVEKASNGRLHTAREWVMSYVERATVFVQW